MPAILRADPTEAESLKTIALASKAHWGYPPEWIARWAGVFHVPPEMVAARDVFKVVEGGEILGWYGLFLRDDTAVLDDLWIIPAAIGTGVGRLLWTHALERARARGAVRLELESDPNAVGFYVHMGASIIGERLSDMGRMLPVMGMDLPPLNRPSPDRC